MSELSQSEANCIAQSSDQGEAVNHSAPAGEEENTLSDSCLVKSHCDESIRNYQAWIRKRGCSEWSSNFFSLQLAKSACPDFRIRSRDDICEYKRWMQKNDVSEQAADLCAKKMEGYLDTQEVFVGYRIFVELPDSASALHAQITTLMQSHRAVCVQITPAELSAASSATLTAAFPADTELEILFQGLSELSALEKSASAQLHQHIHSGEVSVVHIGDALFRGWRIRYGVQEKFYENGDN